MFGRTSDGQGPDDAGSRIGRVDERIALTLSARRDLGLAVVLFAVLTVGMTWPQAARPSLVSDLGDPLFSIWRLAWVAHQLPRDPLHLFDANIFHPERHTLAYSDAMLVEGVSAAPLSWVGVHPVHVYTIVLLSAFALSGVAMFWLVRALTGRRSAAMVAGVAFAFCPYRIDHYSHLELQVALWMPLGLLAFHRTFARGDVRSGLAVGGALALQALSSLYYGIFYVAFLVPVGLVLFAGRAMPGVSKRRVCAALAAGAVLAAALILPVTRPYFEARRVLGGRSRADVVAGSAVGRSYLVASERVAAYRGLIADASTAMSERRLFPGLLVVMLAVVGLWPPWSRERVAYAVATVVAVDVSFGLNGLVYPWLFEWVTPFRGLRVPARAGIIVMLGLSVLAGYGVARLRAWCDARWTGRVGLLMAAALTAGVALEFRPALDLETVWMAPPPIYRWFRDKPPSVIMEVPSASNVTGPITEMKYVYFSVFHWQKLLVGNSGFFPPSHDELTRMMGAFPSENVLAYLRTRGVDYLVLHGGLCDPTQFEDVSAWLLRQPGVRLAAKAPWEGGESRLYDLYLPGSPVR